MKVNQKVLRVASCPSWKTWFGPPKLRWSAANDDCGLRVILAFTVVVMSFPLLAGEPAADAVDLLRRGNAAFTLEDYDKALALYEQSEITTTDPGMVSFNKGAVLFRLGRYREAEIQYLLSRQDAEAERLPRVLYDLGNTLVKESRERDAKLLNRAIQSYQECLRQENAPAELLENARHNLKLAKILLEKAKKIKNPNFPDEQNPNFPSPRPGDSGNEFQDSRFGNDQGSFDGRDGQMRRVRPGDPNFEGGQSDQPKEGGVGNLPPIPDEEKLVSLSPEDTAAYLKRTANRILEERRKYHLMSAPRSTQNIKDW